MDETRRSGCTCSLCNRTCTEGIHRVETLTSPLIQDCDQIYDGVGVGHGAVN